MNKQIDIARVVRYETECCGFLVNYSAQARKNVTVLDRYEEGAYVGTELEGECPGCEGANPLLSEVGASCSNR